MSRNHGGARKNAGRKQKFSEEEKFDVGLRCEKLFNDAINNQINKQIYSFIHYETEIGNQYYDIKRIAKSKRAAFNADPLGEEHRIEMDRLRSSMPPLEIESKAPYGTRKKIKKQVATEFNFTEQDIENIWKYFRRNYKNLYFE